MNECDVISAIRWEAEPDGVVRLIIDDPTQRANTMNSLFRESLRATVQRLRAERENLSGVILTSGKETMFFAGGDLNELYTATRADAAALYEEALSFKAVLRDLETLGLPVVAALTGTALGGGLELALACHRRIAVRAESARFGLPEVTLGLLPGGGGLVRTVRMLGVRRALDKVLLPGTRFTADQAFEVGLVDQVVDTAEDMLAAAREWISQNPAPVQPWDSAGSSVVGGEPMSGELAAALPALPALLRKQSKGAPVPADHHIMCAAVEGAQVDFASAMRLETRYLIDLVTAQVAKNLMKGQFFDPKHIHRGASRPDGHPRHSVGRVAIVGAGMMGAGIAYQCAASGIDVVLVDTTAESAERGKAYARKVLARRLARNEVTEAAAAAILARISPSGNVADTAGAELVIEAVYEDEGLKHQVWTDIDQVVARGTVMGSNTSTLPITGLAAAVAAPASFLGLHFFSPVDRMPLLEIIRGDLTDDATLAKAFDFARQIGKTPIVVNDSRGFFTSRVIGTMVNEGVAMLAEGVPPATIERAATTVGYPVGPMQLCDELNMELALSVFGETAKAAERAGVKRIPHPAEAVIAQMVEQGRAGRVHGAGFYDYEDGKRAGFWTGMAQQFGVADTRLPFRDVQERYLFIEALESVRCMEEGVITSVADANVGSMLGIGYPKWTGGVLQYINQYSGGPAGFLARAEELAERYGSRFAPPPLLATIAGRDELFA